MTTINYCCRKCKYSFKRKKPFTSEICPYCGNKKTLFIDKKDKANKILREMERLNF